jgi:hypothetical protein
MQVSAAQYLGGLLTFLYKEVHRRLIFIGLLTAAAVGIAFFVSRFLPQAYSAPASVRLGHVDSDEVTSPQAAAARINSPSFKQRVLQSMEPTAGDGRAAKMAAVTFTARPESSDTININVQASDKGQVSQALDVIVRLLNEEQDRFGEPVIADIKEQLTASDANVASLLQMQQSLTAQTKMLPETSSQNVDPRALWLLDLVSRNEQQLAAATAERRALAARLGPWRSYPTTLVDSAFIVPVLISSRPATLMIVAGMLTFLACLLYLLTFARRPAGSTK